MEVMIGSIVRPLESGGLHVLKIRRTGRKPIDIEKACVEDPVSFGRAVNVITALERAVTDPRIEKVDERTAVVQSDIAPILKETLEIMDAAIELAEVTGLIKTAQTRDRVA